MTIEPSHIVGAIAVGVGVCAKEISALIYKLATRNREQEPSTSPLPTYTPEDSWRNYCIEKFESITEGVHAQHKKLTEVAIRQEHISEQLERLEFDHKTICTGRK